MSANSLTQTGEGIDETVDKEIDEGEGKCPECTGETVEDTDIGEVFCADCGLVIDESISVVPNPDLVAQHGNRNSTHWQREAGSRVMYDKGLGSVVSEQENFGKSRSVRSRNKRLQRTESWFSGYDDNGSDKGRTLIPGLWEVARLADQLGVPRVVREEASGLLRTVSEEDLLGSPRVEAFSAACIYVGAYVHRVPQTYRMIAEQTDCDQQEIKAAHNRLMAEESIRLDPPLHDRWPRHGPVPWDLVDRFAALVATELDEADGGEPNSQAELVIHGKRLLQKALEQDEMLGNRTSKGLAAGAVYVAGNYASLRVTQAMVSDATQVNQTTVSDIARALRDALE